MNPELSRKHSHYKNNLVNISAIGCTTCPAQLGNIYSPPFLPMLFHTLCMSLQAQHRVKTHRTGDHFSTLYNLINDILLLGAVWLEKGKVGLHLDDPDNAIFSFCVTWLTLVLRWRLRQCYRRRTILDHPDKTRTVRGLTGGRWLLAVRMCSQQGALCHLCCSPGRREECERRSGSRQSFRYETSP